MINLLVAMAVTFVGNLLVSIALLWLLRRIRIPLKAKIATAAIGRFFLLAALVRAIVTPFNSALAETCLFMCAGGLIFQFTTGTLFSKEVREVDGVTEVICYDVLFRRKVLEVADENALAALNIDSDMVNLPIGDGVVKVVRLDRLSAKRP